MNKTDSKCCIYVLETEKSVILGSQSEFDSQIVTPVLLLYILNRLQIKKKNLVLETKLMAPQALYATNTVHHVAASVA